MGNHGMNPREQNILIWAILASLFALFFGVMWLRRPPEKILERVVEKPVIKVVERTIEKPGADVPGSIANALKDPTMKRLLVNVTEDPDAHMAAKFHQLLCEVERKKLIERFGPPDHAMRAQMKNLYEQGFTGGPLWARIVSLVKLRRHEEAFKLFAAATGGPSPTNRQGAQAANGQTARTSATFFRVGSTKSAVLAVHGKPTSTDEYPDLGIEVWTYGKSFVHFKNDHVVAVGDTDGNLKVKHTVTSASTKANVRQAVHVTSPRHQDRSDSLNVRKETSLQIVELTNKGGYMKLSDGSLWRMYTDDGLARAWGVRAVVQKIGKPNLGVQKFKGPDGNIGEGRLQE